MSLKKSSGSLILSSNAFLLISLLLTPTMHIFVGYLAKWLVNVTSFDLENIAEIAYRNTSDHGNKIYFKN